MAETFDQAIAARDVLEITWDHGTIEELPDEDIRGQPRAPILPPTAPPALTDHIHAKFDFAFTSHAPMEVNSAVADVRTDRSETCSSLKSSLIALETSAAALGLPVDRATVHVTRGGRSFGRRLFFDAAQAPSSWVVRSS